MAIKITFDGDGFRNGVKARSKKIADQKRADYQKSKGKTPAKKVKRGK